MIDFLLYLTAFGAGYWFAPSLDRSRRKFRQWRELDWMDQ
jgi:uncharacterized metal-binding protein